ncbi:MAG: hypothetical protein ACRDGG_12045, partial [Anaerolineae bacterium]
VVGKLADAALEGMSTRKDVPAAGIEEAVEADETYLGEATLAKLRAGQLDFGDAASDLEAEDKIEAEADSDNEA